MAVVTVTADSFEQEVLKASGTVLVDFWASWCGPCKMLSPLVDQVAEERTDVKVCKVNVDDEGALAERCGVSSIPTLMVFRDGEQVNTSVGSIPKAKILAML